MQKAVSENVICIACGADVRSEALFCYNCGGAVAIHPESPTIEEPSVSEATPAEPRNPVDSVLEPPGVTTKPLVKELASKDSLVEKDAKPLTAAMMRRKRASNRQPVEIAWEEPAQPSMLFVVMSVVLTVLTVFILIGVLYLR